MQMRKSGEFPDEVYSEYAQLISDEEDTKPMDKIVNNVQYTLLFMLEYR
jgi:hypothetical protein